MVPEYEVVADPVAHFEQDYIDAQPLEARALGCDADYNAWTDGKANPKPDMNMPMRTASGHTHFGWTEAAEGNDHLGMCCAFVKQLDYYLGLPSLLFDNDNQRREMYGKAGAFRPKEYGLEYRVLSNRWLADNDLIRWVYRASQACFVSMGGEQLFNKYGDIQEIINTSNKDAAMGIIQAEGLLLPEGL
jgi:hypothetical protein